MKKKRGTIILIIILAVLVIANVGPIHYLFGENYSYSNYNGTFNRGEENLGTSGFNTVEFAYKQFLHSHPEEAHHDSTLYRTFTVKPWRFWQWSDYIFCPERFQLPYKPN